MKISTKLLLSGAVIISLSLIVFGTDAVLSLLTFYQNLESPSTREMAEGVSDSIGSALFGVLMGFLGVCVFITGFISIFLKSVGQLTGMFTGEDGFLNIDEKTFFTPDTILFGVGSSVWM